MRRCGGDSGSPRQMCVTATLCELFYIAECFNGPARPEVDKIRLYSGQRGRIVENAVFIDFHHKQCITA